VSKIHEKLLRSFDKPVKMFTGSFSKERTIPEESSDDCFPLPQNDVMLIQIIACVDEEQFVFIWESDIDHNMSQNLMYFISCFLILQVDFTDEIFDENIVTFVYYGFLTRTAKNRKLKQITVSIILV
jgi:hypothetical protein